MTKNATVWQFSAGSQGGTMSNSSAINDMPRSKSIINNEVPALMTSTQVHTIDIDNNAGFR